MAHHQKIFENTFKTTGTAVNSYDVDVVLLNNAWSLLIGGHESVFEEACMGARILRSVLVHDLLAIEIKILCLKLTVALTFEFKSFKFRS